jgi:hypothetical protein
MVNTLQQSNSSQKIYKNKIVLALLIYLSILILVGKFGIIYYLKVPKRKYPILKNYGRKKNHAY